jgi:hypothetical protein
MVYLLDYRTKNNPFIKKQQTIAENSSAEDKTTDILENHLSLLQITAINTIQTHLIYH